MVLIEQHNYTVSRGNRQKSWIQKLVQLHKNCSQQFSSIFIEIADVNLEKEVKLKYFILLDMPVIMCDFSLKSQNLKSEHLETSGKMTA